MFIVKILFTLLLNIAVLSAEQKLRIVVSFSILEDLIKVLTADIPNVEISTIVPRNADPHTYQPVPSDSIKLAQANLVFVSGLGFEEWVDKLIKGSGFKGIPIVLSKGVKPRADLLDPHAWHDVQRFMVYVQNAVEILCKNDISNEKAYRKAGQVYIKKLEELDRWVDQKFQDLQDTQRIVLTTHDAFWYFGDRYKVRFLSPVGISTDAEPSPRSISKLIKEIKQKNIKALFFENLDMHRKLLTQISKETGRTIRHVLYADALSDNNGPAPTYIRMMQHNVTTMVNALMSQQ